MCAGSPNYLGIQDPTVLPLIILVAGLVAGVVVSILCWWMLQRYRQDPVKRGRIIALYVVVIVVLGTVVLSNILYTSVVSLC